MIIRIMADIRSVPFSWESFYLLLFVICYLLLSADEISYIPHFSWESFSSSIICYYSISFDIICYDLLFDICYLLLSADEITHTPLSVGIAFVCYYLLLFYFFISYWLFIICYYLLLLADQISHIPLSVGRVLKELPQCWAGRPLCTNVNTNTNKHSYKCKNKHKHKVENKHKNRCTHKI